MQLVKYPGSDGPAVTPETAAFWAAARQGRFMLPRCRQCGDTHWYPRAFCPFCHGDVDWVAASGKAVVQTYAVVTDRQGSYCLAYVKLDEGPLMMTNIVGASADALRLGLAVQVCFEPCANGEHLPVFAPREAQA